MKEKAVNWRVHEGHLWTIYVFNYNKTLSIVNCFISVVHYTLDTIIVLFEINFHFAFYTFTS